MPNVITIPAGITDKDLGDLINAPGYNPRALAEALAGVTNAPHTNGANYRCTVAAAAGGAGGFTNLVTIAARTQYGGNLAAAQELTFYLLRGRSAVESYSWDNATGTTPVFYILTVGGGGVAVDASHADSRTLVNSGGGLPWVKLRTSGAGAATVTVTRVTAAGAAIGTANTQVLQYRAQLDSGSAFVSWAHLADSAAFT